ncbi:MAG: ester cyclase [SAR202 cluster bacterium]|nr:ester cyclase [SAR202 cluster bacterium]
MAEQDAIKTVQANIAAFNAGDAQKMAATTAENAVYEEMATQRRIQGRDATIQLAMEWRQAFPDAKGTIQRITASGNTVTAEIFWEGTHKGALPSPAGTIPATGKKVQMRAVQVTTVEGGKLKHTNHYFDLMTMLQQIGAAPQQTATTAQQAGATAQQAATTAKQ